MLRDQQTDALSDLGTDIPMTERRRTEPAAREASGLNGIALAGTASRAGPVRVQVAAAVPEQTSIKAIVAVGGTTPEGVRAVTNAFRRSEAAREDPAAPRQIATTQAEPDRLRYILFVDPVRLRSKTVAFASEQSFGGAVSVIDISVGRFRLSLPQNVSASCRAVGTERATSSINAIAIEAAKRHDGQTGFRSGVLFRGRLSEAPRVQ